VGCELVALLSAYREEERQLFPEVYLLAPTEGDLLPALAPGAPVLKIGECRIADDAEEGARQTARAALKSCASLAIDGWVIYIQRAGLVFQYGLFRPATQSYSVGAAAVLANSGWPCAILRNSAHNTVEIVNSVGCRLEISLTTATPSKRSMSDQISEFSRAACSDLAEEEQEQAAGYLTRVLIDFLRACHGALLAVTPMGAALERERFPDGIIFPEPVPLLRQMLLAVKERSADAVSSLRSHESLLRGMIVSDGVTILGTDGSIRAFRVFVHTTSDSDGERARSVGGARSRAFEALRRCLGSPLTAILLRSQDGRMEVETYK
jgi:hypothetical protein